jgi:ubiquinol-cytochrome c reductase iron-sulfur subunit
MNERWIGPAFIVSFLCGVGLCFAYGFDANAQIQGLLIGGAFAGMGTGMILWGKHLFPTEEVEQERHTIESEPEDEKSFQDFVEQGALDVTRRRFLSRLGGAALGALGVAALFPLRSLGPSAGNSLFHTDWKGGMRLTTEDGTPVLASALQVGGVLTVWPEGVERHEKDATLLIKVPAAQNKPRKGRETWIVDGNVAYSKICTHVGCPVGLYRETTHELLCPCHQSTFNVLDGARAVFGPAARSLPQLPLAKDPQGYLIAQSDYKEPIGPGFWNRGTKKES